MRPSRYAKVLALIGLVLCASLSRAQSVVAFQGGEGTPSDNWTFQTITNAGGVIPPGIVAVAPRTGSFAIRAGGGSNLGCTTGTNCITGGANQATGCPMHGNTIQFDPVNVACLSNVQLSVYHRSHPGTCSGAGWDASDNLNFEVRLNGGAWVTVQTLIASGDYLWTYATNPAGIPATVPNPWTYAVPPGTTSFEFRVRATVNRSDEVFYLDDVTLTTTTTGYNFPGTAGLWNGLSDNNWFNPCNWDNRAIPTAATNVVFPTASNNDIVVQSGQNCVCNNLTCTGVAGRNIQATADPSKMITIFGNLTNSTTAGSAVLRFSDGVIGTADGTINLYGNWLNNSSANDFDEGESTVNLLGAGNQTIALTTLEPTEDFGNLTVNKTGGDVLLNKSIQVKTLLTLNNGKITTGANAVVVSNPLPLSVAAFSPASYINGNLVRAILTGPGSRAYAYPLGTAANYELATLNLVNPSGFTAIGGFFNPIIAGALPNFVEDNFLYDDILNAGVWTLTPDAPYVGTYDITLEERGYTNGGALSYVNVKRPDALGIWANPGTHVSDVEASGVVTCTRAGLSSFSDFAIALSNVIILPIEDLRLQAEPLGSGDVQVDWQWTNATRKGSYHLEREFEGKMLELGNWTIEETLEMSALDPDAPEGLLRYHLYHIDLNGQRTFAATAEVLNASSPDLAPVLWPNPFSGIVHLQLGGTERWQLELVRVDGARLMAAEGTSADVIQAFETAAADLPAGVYILNCKRGLEAFHLKLVKR